MGRLSKLENIVKGMVEVIHVLLVMYCYNI